MNRFVDQFFIQITGKDEAPALVFLHGVMGYAMNWRRVAKHFEDRYKVIAYDSRGHGRSSHADLKSNPDAYTPEALAEDLRGILDDLGLQRVTLIGHSMGGRVSYTFAAKYPERVQALVIEDIGPTSAPAAKSTPVKVIDTVPVPFADKHAAKAWFDTEFPKLFASERDPRALGAWLYANMTENEAGQGVWRFHADGIKAAVEGSRAREHWAEIKSLKMPTLVIRGETSKEFPRDVYDRMLASNPNIEGVEISGAGHWVHSDQFEPFVAVLEEFLAKQG